MYTIPVSLKDINVDLEWLVFETALTKLKNVGDAPDSTSQMGLISVEV